MVASIIMIALALYWLMVETDYLRVRLPYGKVLPIATDKPIAETQAVKLLTASKPVLALPVGDPTSYPMTLTTDIKTLKAMIAELSATELELTEEVWGYDYTEQA